MSLNNALARTISLCLAAVLAGCIEAPPIPDQRTAYTVSGDASVTVPFVFDNNRMFVDLAFVEPDGSLRKARAFVNQGSGSFVLTNTLYRELRIGEGKALRMQIGTMEIAADPRAVQPEDMANSFTLRLNPFGKPQTAAEAAKGPGGGTAAMSAPMNVEAILPPGLLANFTTVFDYGKKTLTLAAPGTLKPEGVAVPIRVNPVTGFATLDVSAGGKTYPAVIDDGGSYGLFRASVVAGWVETHPEWLRAEGGVGESNLTMSGDFETGAQVVKVPDATLGTLHLSELGIIAPTAQGLFGLVEDKFWDWYSAKAGEKVSGAIAGNLMKSFRITFDYRNGMSYWLQEAPLDTHDLDQVGLTLVHMGGHTGIVGIAKKNGAETVSGVQPGDEILAIDGHPTAAMTRGEVLDALHGTPGERKHLILKRQGKEIDVDVPVTRF
jgi:hypothetical protein